MKTIELSHPREGLSQMLTSGSKLGSFLSTGPPRLWKWNPQSSPHPKQLCWSIWRYNNYYSTLVLILRMVFNTFYFYAGKTHNGHSEGFSRGLSLFCFFDPQIVPSAAKGNFGVQVKYRCDHSYLLISSYSSCTILPLLILLFLYFKLFVVLQTCILII
jgi:hypothetical protein